MAARWLAVVVLSAALGLVSARPALAHAVNFIIWGYGFDIESGGENHYWHHPDCFQCPWDYYLQTTVTVYQAYAGAGTFDWHWLNKPAGGVLNPSGGSAWLGHNTWIYDGNGQANYIADLWCTPVNSDMSLGAWIPNNGVSGFWIQDSGYNNGPSCSGQSYQISDKMAVQAGN